MHVRVHMYFYQKLVISFFFSTFHQFGFFWRNQQLLKSIILGAGKKKTSTCTQGNNRCPEVFGQKKIKMSQSMRKGHNVILHHFVYWPVEVNKCYMFFMQWHIFERPYLNQFKQFSETVFLGRFVLHSRNQKSRNLTIYQKWRQVPFLMLRLKCRYSHRVLTSEQYLYWTTRQSIISKRFVPRVIL